MTKCHTNPSSLHSSTQRYRDLSDTPSLCDISLLVSSSSSLSSLYRLTTNIWISPMITLICPSPPNVGHPIRSMIDNYNNNPNGHFLHFHNMGIFPYPSCSNNLRFMNIIILNGRYPLIFLQHFVNGSDRYFAPFRNSSYRFTFLG